MQRLTFAKAQLCLRAAGIPSFKRSVSSDTTLSHPLARLDACAARMQANTISGVAALTRALAASLPLGSGASELPSYGRFACQEPSASPIVVRSEEMEHLGEESIRREVFSSGTTAVQQSRFIYKGVSAVMTCRRTTAHKFSTCVGQILTAVTLPHQ